MSPESLSAAALGSGCLVFILLGIAAVLVPIVFYLLSMQRALTLAGPENRTLEPGMVWLMLIPLFGMVWQFFVVLHVSRSVKNWAAAHGREVQDAGWNIGLTACILFCCGIIPFLGTLTSLAGLICWIVFWVKVADFNKMMSAPTV